MPLRSFRALLQGAGWSVRALNSMTLLGNGAGRAGQRVFDALMTVPGAYDGLHFAHLRTGSAVARALDSAAASRAVRALRADLDREPVVLYTSSPTFAGDVKVAEAIREANPSALIGFAGPTVAVEPERSLLASPAIDFVAGEEFDFTIKEVAEGRPLSEVSGLSYRARNGAPRHNHDRDLLTDMDALPFVTPVYKRDLRIEDYYIGYLKHPYVSLYTGRGCRSRCTFCRWPQTVGGHRYRTRSAGSVLAEAALARGCSRG